MNRRSLVVVIMALAGVASLVLLFSSGGAAAGSSPRPVLAAAHDFSSPVAALASELHVCTAGPPACDYASVQDAVDAAGEGDVIKVAAGIYTGVHMRPRNDVTTTGVVTQLVYISNTVTIQGGYTTTNWVDADPVGNPTTLNAQAKGRVIYAAAGSAATIAGLRITGGDAAGLGGDFTAPTADSGGGIYVYSASADLHSNWVFENVASGGGGIYASPDEDADALITISGNEVFSNTAHAGGGMALGGGAPLISYNSIHDNQALNTGGGMEAFLSCAHVNGNTIYANSAARRGGGIGLQGEGKADGQDCVARLTNNLIAGNRIEQVIGGAGNGISIAGASPQIVHNTIARNIGGAGAIHTEDWEGASRPQLVNVLIADQRMGFHATESSDVSVDGVLWYDVLQTIDTSGSASVAVRHELAGDPAFAGDGYHLMATSAAIDAGVGTDEGSDIDAQVRPMAWGHDLGCDEYPNARLLVAKSTPAIVVNPGATLTYTITITSDGELDATGVVLTDTLDGWQRGLTVASSQGPCTLPDTGWGGHAVCTPGTLASGTRVVVTLTAEVSPGADIGQQVVNQVEARSNETSGFSSSEAFVQDCHVRIDDGATEYATVQAAVDAAASRQWIKVAGTCLGAGMRNGLLQQVYLDKDLTIQGGYTTSNWTVPDPAANPTSLDALSLGRVVYVSPGVSTTIAGLEIKSGDTDPVFESHGVENLDEIGGGIFALTSTVRLRDCHLRDNWASVGGALWMQGCSVEISDSTLEENRAFYAGGFGLDNCQSLLARNTIHANSASDYSGGGGAIFGGQATLDRNLLTENQAEARSSGGLLVWRSEITMTNNVVSDNRAVSSGAAVRLIDAVAHLRHNTFARNESGDGTGIHISGSSSSVGMTNTILVDHGVGISVTGVSELNMDGVLWHKSPVTVAQDSGAHVTIQNQHSGDPAFQGDGYHLSAYSAAVDKGSDAGVAVDIDGEPRPQGAGYDLGADEDGVVADVALTVSDDPDPVVVGEALTYTISVANNGPAGATGIIMTETLPGGVTYVSASAGCARDGGIVTCDPGPLAAGEGVTFTIHVTPDSVGQLINLAQVTASELDSDPSNNSQVEYTAVSAAPVLGPLPSGVRPSSGVNNALTPITIDGDRFEDGATVSLGGVPLQSVLYVDAQRLLAVVPNGLAPGTRGVTVTNPDARSRELPHAFTVLTPDPPALARVKPAQGPNDIPVTLEIHGSNFSPDVAASLSLDEELVPLASLVFLDATRLLADVPVSTTLGLYAMTLTNPDNQSTVLAKAYRVLEPAANNDLYAEVADLWLDPPSIRERFPVTIGLTLRRQGGQADLHDVDVRFTLEGGTPAFTATVPLLPPRSHVTVTVDWAPPPTQGNHTLYAQIDPLDVIPENNEGNNLISRRVTVLPPVPDATPPTVDSFTIDNGALYVPAYWAQLHVEASDNPGGTGVAHLLFVEYLLVQSESDWVPVSISDWLPYDLYQTRRWELSDRPGAHYFQVWAADAAGNISVVPRAQMINRVYVQGPCPIGYGEVHVYRVPMAIGDVVEVSVRTSYAVNVRIYPPLGDNVVQLWADQQHGGRDMTRLSVVHDGIYQIEVWGEPPANEVSLYTLSVKNFGGSALRTSGWPKSIEEVEPEPVIPPAYAPGRRIGLPSPVSASTFVYLPVVVRGFGP